MGSFPSLWGAPLPLGGSIPGPGVTLGGAKRGGGQSLEVLLLIPEKTWGVGCIGVTLPEWYQVDLPHIRMVNTQEGCQ